MGKTKRWNKTYAEFAKEFGVNESSFKFWAREGHDLNSDEVVKSLVSKSRNNPNSSQRDSKPRKLVLTSSLGLAGSLERLRQAELELSTAYVSALGAGNSDSFTLRKEWLDVCEQLRKAEKDSPDVLEANKKTITVDELQKVLLQLFNDLRSSIEGIPARVTKELPQEVGTLVLSSLRKEIQDIIEDLYKCKFIGGAE
jgi:hypothetical protein